MADRTGQRLGNYRLTQLLGRGGFAEVYLGEHVRLGILAAVKVPYTRLASPEEVESFEKEARTIAHLRHPHIVRVFDFDVVDDIPFLVMDYAPNGTLRKLHPRGTKLPLALILTYVKQIADALQQAHDQRIIHRDIKPENMLLGQDNELLLSDFGIATISQSSRYEGKQDMAGTIAYTAPEQLQGKPRPASDQYALGIVAYEWLSGERPFHGSFTEIAAQHVLTPPPSLREKMPVLSPGVEQVVMTALAKDPKARFATIHAFANALGQAHLAEQALGSAPTILTTPNKPASTMQPVPEVAPASPSPAHPVAPEKGREWTVVPPSDVAAQSAAAPTSGAISPPPVPGPLRTIASTPWLHASTEAPAIPPSPRPAAPPPRRISRRTLLIGLAGVVVAGGGGITWWVFATSPRPLSTSHPLYTYRGHSNAVNAVAWSPDGTRVASAGSDNTVQVWNATDGSQAFTYHNHSNAVNGVAWSPNGSRIASGSWDNTVQVWKAADGSHVYIYPGHFAVVEAVAWSPDGTRIASGSWDNTVQVWNAADGSNRYTYRGHFNAVRTVAWSHNGTRIASAGYDQTVQVWNAADGSNVFTYHGHIDVVNGVAWSPNSTRIASANVDSVVQVWNAADGSHVFTYHGHSSVVEAVAWSPDGTRIASASLDKTVQVWNAADGSHVFTYHGHSDIVNAVAWSPDGTRIASASSDKTVQVWQPG
jgi:eukaryotic-like serine/threonine-protein kinase